MRTMRYAATCLALLLTATTAWGAPKTAGSSAGRIVIQPRDYASTTLKPADQKKVQKGNVLHGIGEATYDFKAPRTGWYELWAQAARWGTILKLDGKFLIYTPFESGVWKPAGPGGKTQKVMNLHLTQGEHKLTVSRTWFPGLPYLHKLYLQPAKDVTGQVRVSPVKDYLSFRKGEAFPVVLRAAKHDQPYALTLSLADPKTGNAERTIEQRVPAGEGLFTQKLDIPTDQAGVFDLRVTDAQGQAVDRITQFLVVDTKSAPRYPEKLHKELVQEIDCAKQKPDYDYGGGRVVNSALGAYYESGPKGVRQALTNTASFAYTLNLPSTQEFYLVEVDYPDDDLRFFTISVVDSNGFGFPPSPGVLAGGPYPLSGKMQTRTVMFIPRSKHPRIVFMPWQSGMEAAAARIRVYRVGDRLPSLVESAPVPWSKERSDEGHESQSDVAFTRGLAQTTAPGQSEDAGARRLSPSPPSSLVESATSRGAKRANHSPSPSGGGRVGKSTNTANTRHNVDPQRANLPSPNPSRREGGHQTMSQSPTAHRIYGVATEEAYRIPHFFGAMPDGGNSFANLAPPTRRKAQWSKFVGINLWRQSVAIYDNILWPSHILIHGQPGDETTAALPGPYTLKEPFRKDLIRMMLLYGEKYGIGISGELYLSRLPLYEDQIAQAAEARNPDAAKTKPWKIVSRTGKVGDKSTRLPYFNPVCPAVQDFVASVVQELADRYKDSPAFKGLALRLMMAWVYKSWQTFPSIDWGYGDYTIHLFEKETGTKIPVSDHDPKRYAKRYDWLMAHAYDQWVNWRCQKIHAWWMRLADILKKARPDLTLSIEVGSIPSYTYQSDTAAAVLREGWLRLAKEAGIDPALYRNDPNLILEAGRSYPAGFGHAVRGQDPDFFTQVFTERLGTLLLDSPLATMIKTIGKGTAAYLHLEQTSYENYPRFDAYGMKGGGDYGTSPRKKGTFPVSGAIAPAGPNYMQIYASSMADGNLFEITDFQRGPVMDQYRQKRAFMAQYLALPAIGMTRLKNDDPVACWYGTKDGRTYFYVVNRAYYPVKVTLTFHGPTKLKPLTMDTATTLSGDALTLDLQPYQLLSFVNDAGGVPASLSAAAPANILKQLAHQIDQAGKILSSTPPKLTLTPISPVRLDHAKEKLEQARQALKEGHTVAARQALGHPDLVAVYQAFDAWPPHIWSEKLPQPPADALKPQAMLDAVVPGVHTVTQGTGGQAASGTQAVGSAEAADRARGSEAPAQIRDASVLTSRLTGEPMLTWANGALPLSIRTPLHTNYRLTYCYARQPPYARPMLSVDGRPAPGQSSPETQTEAWGEQTLGVPIPLTAGAHVVTAAISNDQRGGLFFLSLTPIFHPITANLWRVIGPFPHGEQPYNQHGTGLDTAYPPQKQRNFSASYTGANGQQVSWVTPTFTSDHVDLHKITGVFNKLVSYAVTSIDCPRTRKAQLKFGVDYWAKIWLNGKKVFEITKTHGPPGPGQFTIPIALKKGANELMVKVQAGSAGNGFWLSISDPGDLKIHAP